MPPPQAAVQPSFYPFTRFQDLSAALARQSQNTSVQAVGDAAFAEHIIKLQTWVNGTDNLSGSFPLEAAQCVWQIILSAPTSASAASLNSKTKEQGSQALAPLVLHSLLSRCEATWSSASPASEASPVSSSSHPVAAKREAAEFLKLAIYFGAHLVLQPESTAGKTSHIAGGLVASKLTAAGLSCLLKCCELQLCQADSFHEMAMKDRKAVDKLLMTVLVQKIAALNTGGKHAATAPQQTASKASLAAILSALACRPGDGLHVFMSMTQELCQLVPAAAAHGAAGTAAAPSLICDCMLLSIQRERQLGYKQVLLLAAVAGNLLGEAPSMIELLSVAQAEVVVQAVAALVADCADPVLAMLVLQHVKVLQYSSKAVWRKLVLDVASTGMPGPPVCRQICLAVLVSGSQDLDATVRAKALMLLAPDLGLLMVPAICKDCVNPSPQPALMIEQLLPALKERLLDTAKSVRAKALMLVSALITGTLEPGNSLLGSSDMKAKALHAWFPELCVLMSQAETASHEEATHQVISNIFKCASSTMRPETLLSMVLPALMDGAGSGAGLLATSLLGSMHCAPEHTESVFDTWAGFMIRRDRQDQLDHLSEAVQGSFMVVPMQQSSYSKLCSLLLEAQSCTAGAADNKVLLTSMLRAVKVIYCFTSCKDASQILRKGCNIRAAKPATASSAAVATDACCMRAATATAAGEDQEGELGILMDVLMHIVRLVAASSSTAAPLKPVDRGLAAEAAGGDVSKATGAEAAAAAAAVAAGSSAAAWLQQECLVWGLRVLEKVLCSAGSGSASAAAAAGAGGTSTAAKQAATPAASTAHGEVPADPAGSCCSRVPSMVLKFLLHHRHLLLLQCRHTVASSFLDVLCKCPGSSMHLTKLLTEYEQSFLVQSDQLGSSNSSSNSTSELRVPVKTATSYLLLLERMAVLYEHEKAAFELKFAAAGNAVKDAAVAAVAEQQEQAGQPHGRLDTVAEDRGTASDSALPEDETADISTKDKQQDYMQREEQARQLQDAVLRFVDSLVDTGTAPACRIPLLLQILQAGAPPGQQLQLQQQEQRDTLWAAQQQQQQQVGETPQALQQQQQPGETLQAVQQQQQPGETLQAVQQQQQQEGEALQAAQQQQQQDQQGAQVLQVLALRALGRLMTISERLAQQHGHVLASILTSAAAAVRTSSAAGVGSAGTPDTAHPAGVASVPGRDFDPPVGSDCGHGVLQHEGCPPCSHLLTLSAVQIVETLVLRSPNINGCLLPKLEALILAFLEACRSDQSTHVDTAAQAQHAPCALDAAAAEGRSREVDRCALPLSKGPSRGQVLLEAAASFVRILSADKLQLLGPTFAVVGKMLLSTNAEVQGLAEHLVLQLAGSTSKVPAAGGASQLRRHKIMMSLYSNGHEEQRQALVEEVLLPRLLSPQDLESETLVLPVLQSFLVATSKAGRMAAASLLASMTPTAKALVVLLAACEGIPVDQLDYTSQVLHAIKAFVQRYKQQARSAKSQAAAAAASGVGKADAVAATAGPGVHQNVHSDASAKVVHAKLVTLLDGFSSQLAKGRKRKPSGEDAAAAARYSSIASDTMLDKMQQQLDEFAAEQHTRQHQREAGAKHITAVSSSTGQGPGCGEGVPTATGTSAKTMQRTAAQVKPGVANLGVPQVLERRPPLPPQRRQCQASNAAIHQSTRRQSAGAKRARS